MAPFPRMTLAFLVSWRSSPVKSHREGGAGVLIQAAAALLPGRDRELGKGRCLPL